MYTYIYTNIYFHIYTYRERERDATESTAQRRPQTQELKKSARGGCSTTLGTVAKIVIARPLLSCMS